MEAVTLVCDVCHQPAKTTARITVDSKNHLKDLCATHLAELLAGSRAPRRGRPRKDGASIPRTRKKSTTTRSTAKRKSASKSGARKKTTKRPKA